MIRCFRRATGLQPEHYAQPFDQALGSSLIYLFYMHATIRQKYMVFFHLIFLFCTTIRPKIRVLIDLFFYVHATIRPKYMVFFYLFILSNTTIRPKIRVHTDLFLLFVHHHSTEILGPHLFIFYVHATIRQKYMVFFH